MDSIRMNVTKTGSPDGLRVEKYMKDAVYSEAVLGKSLMKSFLSTGVAVKVVETPPVENKAISTAPQKQAMDVAPANMGRKRKTRKG